MLVGISGKLGSGKDLAYFLIVYNNLSNYNKQMSPGDFYRRYKYADFAELSNKKCADTLKDIICMLIGCNRTQLEDRNFKEKELGEEWWYYKIYIGNGKYDLVNYLTNDKPLSWLDIANPRYLVKPTPRLLLQLLGTECGRGILHPNIWVNSLFSHYNPYKSNWIVTDVRFPNEADKVLELGGTLIRIERPGKDSGSTHESETALDNYTKFTHTIINDGSVKDLSDKIHAISHSFGKIHL